MILRNFRCIDDAGALVATFDVEFKPLTVRRVKLFRKDDGGMFIQEPSEKYQKDGKTEYWKHVLITDELVRNSVLAKAKEIYREQTEKLPVAAAATPDTTDPMDMPF